MLSGVLRSDRAIAVNIEIMRAFVELRRVAGSFDELQKRLDQMELDIGARLSEHDVQLRQLRDRLRAMSCRPKASAIDCARATSAPIPRTRPHRRLRPGPTGGDGLSNRLGHLPGE